MASLQLRGFTCRPDSVHEAVPILLESIRVLLIASWIGPPTSAPLMSSLLRSGRDQRRAPPAKPSRLLLIPS